MILAILQARMSSSRLPGKVAMDANGQPMLAYEISRILQSQKIDQLVIATSTNPEDDMIEEIAKQCHIECFRGSLNNVLDRYYQCAKKYNATHIVRLTGDCPIIDANIIDAVIHLHLQSQADYTSNGVKRTFPDGMDTEIMTFATLQNAFLNAKTQEELEHVTYYIYTHPENFRIKHYCNDIDYSHIRWTLDYPKDYLLLKDIIQSQPNNTFSWKDLL
ncbi:glycosyltransferase family protein [Helicobacter kayseriensis]|uniref:glycosyltransferase family protein n=1 Tax=Helicobacter kayseriensis TaxID=2905877 RepID=UPI001E37A53A|nr:glycosyltransferase family protein [Helicobacter kayseriensis]MCE3046664.1 glycosyltransferase family protein [Helicobacter kayseriensis]MCE3048034.1 glycosyltransferase family protein [Helicobacter kayseriensis]